MFVSSLIASAVGGEFLGLDAGIMVMVTRCEARYLKRERGMGLSLSRERL